MVHAPEEMDRKQVKSIEDSLMDIWDLTNLPFKLFHLNRFLFKAFILPGSGYTIAKAHVSCDSANSTDAGSIQLRHEYFSDWIYFSGI